MVQEAESRRHIAFYAPLKAPDHPVPSGDREMARLILRALDLAGFDATVAAHLRAFSRTPDNRELARLQSEAATIRDILLDHYKRNGAPDLWLTYHPFYKAPDLIGVDIAGQLGIPYVTVEASHAPKRNWDSWQPWQALAEQSLQMGAAHFCLTRRDRLGLEAFLGDKKALFDLPPFLDGARFETLVPTQPIDGPFKLVTVAMMRTGDKLQSYRFLAEALALLPDVEWRLTIIGDGPARNDVEAAFAGVEPTRLTWQGAIAPEEVSRALAGHDLYVWPGFGEAYGMAYLEAQAAGLPVLALDCGGISEVMQPGRTGFLLPPGTPIAYAAALRSLLSSRQQLQQMGDAARRFVLQERTLPQAAGIFKRVIGAFLQ